MASTLLDELTTQPSLKCKFCVWLETLTPAQRAEWTDALALPEVKTGAALRVARKKGYVGNDHGVLARHRANHYLPQ